MAENEKDTLNEKDGMNEADSLDENNSADKIGNQAVNDSVNDDDFLHSIDEEYDEEYDEGDSLFEPVDVSEPRAPIKELDVIEEALAVRRRDWVKSNRTYIFAGVGLVVVILIVLLISLLFRSSNPMSRFTSSLSNNFGTSFQFELQMTEDDKPMMSYSGSVAIDRSKHTAQAVYEADYNSYQYTGTVYADRSFAKKGSYYDSKWLVRDCMDNALDFFDFDRDFRSGKFDAGSFLRFTGLTSDFSTRELDEFANKLMKRLSTDSDVATIKTDKADGESRYHYDISVQALYDMVKEDGASIFYRASDYDTFCASYELNKDIITAAKCTVDFTVNGSGNMTLLDAKITANGKTYGLTCRMSDFGKTEVEIPEGFLKEAQITLPE